MSPLRTQRQEKNDTKKQKGNKIKKDLYLKVC